MNKKDAIFSDMFIFSFRRHDTNVLTSEQLRHIGGKKPDFQSQQIKHLIF